MRVLIAGTQHETHTFSEEKIDWSKFEEQEVLHGEDVICRRVGSRTPIGGMIDGARKGNMEIVGAFAARATPAGLISEEALSIILGFLVEETQKHKDYLDGVLLELHGAMASENCDDVDVRSGRGGGLRGRRAQDGRGAHPGEGVPDRVGIWLSGEGLRCLGTPRSARRSGSHLP